MKKTYLLFALLVFVLSACKKKDETHQLRIEVATDAPLEFGYFGYSLRHNDADIVSYRNTAPFTSDTTIEEVTIDNDILIVDVRHLDTVSRNVSFKYFIDGILTKECDNHGKMSDGTNNWVCNTIDTLRF